MQACGQLNVQQLGLWAVVGSMGQVKQLHPKSLAPNST